SRHTPTSPSFPTRRSSDLVVPESVELEESKSEEVTVEEIDQLTGKKKIILKSKKPKPVDQPEISEVVSESVELEESKTEEITVRSEEHTSELQSRFDLVCR